MDYVGILLFIHILLAYQQNTQKWVIVIKFSYCWYFVGFRRIQL